MANERAFRRSRSPPFSDAVPLARALVSGGLRAIEVTLRTKAALDSIAAIAAEVEGAVVGVGAVLEPGQLAAAQKAGARFAVSPGVANASEAMALIARGYRFAKFFRPGRPAASAI